MRTVVITPIIKTEKIITEVFKTIQRIMEEVPGILDMKTTIIIKIIAKETIDQTTGITVIPLNVIGGIERLMKLPPGLVMTMQNVDVVWINLMAPIEERGLKDTHVVI